MSKAEWNAKLKLPLVQTASELAARLTGVMDNPAYQPGAAYGYAHCTLAADAPCHSSASGRSFVFGDTPGGGITMRCMACAGGGLYKRVEDALGVRVQYQHEDGRLKYWRDDKPPTGRERRKHTDARRTRKPAEHAALNATPLPDGYTVGDLFGAARWFLSDGKKPATFRWRGRLSGFRQSLPAEDGGARLCKHGGADVVRPSARTGKPYRTRILGWGTLAQVKAMRGMLGERGAGFGLGLALTGDADMPADGAIGVVDFDYKPLDKDGEPQDPDGLGAAWRDGAKARLAAAGLPIWDSTSGNGFHALFAVGADEMRGGYIWQTEPEVYPEDGAWNGARIDLFAPGCRRLVALRIEKPHANTDGAAVIPTLARADYQRLIRPEANDGTTGDRDAAQSGRGRAGSDSDKADADSEHAARGDGQAAPERGRGQGGASRTARTGERSPASAKVGASVSGGIAGVCADGAKAMELWRRDWRCSVAEAMSRLRRLEDGGQAVRRLDGGYEVWRIDGAA